MVVITTCIISYNPSTGIYYDLNAITTRNLVIKINILEKELKSGSDYHTLSILYQTNSTSAGKTPKEK